MLLDTSGRLQNNIVQWGGTAVVTGGVAGIPAVGGNIAEGVAPTAYPVRMAGWDGTLLRTLKTDTSGNIGIGATAAGGALISRIVATASTNVTSIKAGTGKLYGYSISNTTASAFYVKFYNIASGSVVVGTTAIVDTLYVPATGTWTGTFVGDIGIGFATAISYSTTANAVDSDTTVIGAGPIIHFYYI